jgi:ubiquinol-cytochrome c reductase cytochrome b subunit
MVGPVPRALDAVQGVAFAGCLAVFAMSFVALGYLGLQPAGEIDTAFSRLFSLLFFAFFLLLPVHSAWDPVKPLPERVG